MKRFLGYIAAIVCAAALHCSAVGFFVSARETASAVPAAQQADHETGVSMLLPSANAFSSFQLNNAKSPGPNAGRGERDETPFRHDIAHYTTAQHTAYKRVSACRARHYSTEQSPGKRLSLLCVLTI